MITLYRTDKSVIGEFPVDSVKKAVKHAVRQSISLVNVNLEGANFKGVNLTGVNLRGASLEGANCADANFAGANFAGANLKWANFTGANLEWANFTGANLARARLTGSNFKWATLDYAAVSFQCKSTGAITDDHFVAQLIYLLTRQDHSGCSEEVKRDLDIIKSLSVTNLLAKYRNDIEPI